MRLLIYAQGCYIALICFLKGEQIEEKTHPKGLLPFRMSLFMVYGLIRCNRFTGRLFWIIRENIPEIFSAQLLRQRPSYQDGGQSIRSPEYHSCVIQHQV